MEGLKDLKKIINQVLGRGNMFGFKTTLANHFYLMFCIMGNVYVTEKLHRFIKYVWISWINVPYFFLISFWVAMYAKYGFQPKEILLPIYTAFVLLLVILELIFIPINTVLWNRNNMEEMVVIADRILLKKSTTASKVEGEFDIKTVAIVVGGTFLTTLMIYSMIVLGSVPVFYDEAKTKDYLYYAVPLTGLQYYGSLTVYICWTASYMLPASGVFIVCFVQIVFPVLVATVCHNEAHRIIADLNSLSSSDLNIETYQTIEPKFRDVVKRSIVALNDLTRMMSCFRSFFEPLSGFIMPCMLYFEIIHALILVNPNYSYMVKMREILVFVITILQVYGICWVGQTMEDLTDELSFAVYSTPWYWFKSIRKDVYILLCQAQKSNSPVALNVYPLTYATFLRFCNVIQSSVNVCRATFFRQE